MRSAITTLLLHPFNGLFSRTTWVSWHQKGKLFWILLAGARDDGMAVASAEPYAHHLHLAPDRCQYLNTKFLQAGCPSCCQTNSVKALKAIMRSAMNDLIITAQREYNVPAVSICFRVRNPSCTCMLAASRVRQGITAKVVNGPF